MLKKHVPNSLAAAMTCTKDISRLYSVDDISIVKRVLDCEAKK
jgi:hypothetical protein